jgi:hypothetical protein
MCAEELYDCNDRWADGHTYLYLFMARDGDGPMYVKVGVSDDPYGRAFPETSTECCGRVQHGDRSRVEDGGD